MRLSSAFTKFCKHVVFMPFPCCYLAVSMPLHGPRTTKRPAPWTSTGPFHHDETNGTSMQSDKKTRKKVLFVEILFIIRLITFRCSRMLNRQNRRTLPHNFSSLRPATFATHQALVNGHFCQTQEKLCSRNDAAPEALSVSHAKRIVSETMAFAFFRPVDDED
jgi:hypothetical protein